MTDSLICADLFRHAAERPEQPAVITVDGILSYAALGARVRRYSQALTDAGLAPGDVVAISMADGADALAALLAALDAGTAFVWLDPEQPGRRHRAIATDCTPRGLLTAAPIAMDTEALVGDTGALVMVGGDAVRFVQPAVGTADPAVPTDTACLVYTSGSTGAPKGIVQRRPNLDQFAAWFAGELGIGDESRVLQWGRFTYDAAYVEIVTAIHAGAALVLPPANVKADGPKLDRWLTVHRVTHMMTVPSLCRVLLQARDAAGAPALATVRAVGLFGEVLHERLVTATRRHFPNAAVYNLYGPTECILATFLRVPDDPIGTVPIGHPIPGREILLYDEDGGSTPPGQVGEIVIRSPYLAHGYLNMPDVTDDRFQPDPVNPDHRRYRTGDLGRLLADGTFDFLGRQDSQVKIRGARVELGEIETALYADPGVAHAAVRVFDSGDSSIATAYVQPRSGQRVEVSTLHRTLALTLPTYLLPATYVVLDKMPLTSTGKIDRMRLPEPDALTPETSDGSAGAEPATETERALAAIWCEVLGRTRVGRDDVFFTLGGHSLLVPQVTAQVAEKFGVELPIRAAFEYPSLWELAEHIDDLVSTGS